MTEVKSNPIGEYRKAALAVRTIIPNDMTTWATDALHRQWDIQDDIIRSLLASGDDILRHIAGLLTEEARLMGQDWKNRPQVKAGLSAVQRELRQLEKEFEKKL
jgi:hypothetical protein